jgi:hypothetical protein
MPAIPHMIVNILKKSGDVTAWKKYYKLFIVADLLRALLERKTIKIIIKNIITPYAAAIPSLYNRSCEYTSTEIVLVE